MRKHLNAVDILLMHMSLYLFLACIQHIQCGFFSTLNMLRRESIFFDKNAHVVIGKGK